MKKSKEILIWGSTLLCIYFVAWLIFTLDIFSKGKDIENNLKMALGVVFLLLCGGVIAMVHKEYDYRKYAAYISGVISVALIIQIALQGEAMGEKRVFICFFSCILSGLLGILTTLIGTKKIEIKNRHIKEIGIYFLTLFGFGALFLASVMKNMLGTRGRVIMKMFGSQENATKGVEYISLIFPTILFFIATMSITTVILDPKEYKSRKYITSDMSRGEQRKMQLETQFLNHIVWANLCAENWKKKGFLDFKEKELLFGEKYVYPNSEKIKIFYKDIAEVRKEKLFGIFPNQMTIVKRDGTEYRFFLEKRNKVVEFLQTR